MEILSEVLNTSYSHKKPQVKIVSHDKNRGASVARNSGLSAATGQYVIFADSDDWVKQDAYAMMYEKAVKHDYDIIWSDYYISSDGSWVSVRKKGAEASDSGQYGSALRRYD